MIRKLSTVLLAVLVVLSAMSLPAAAREIAEKTLPEEITVGQDTLYLNGAGVRVKWFMDIYAMGLYLKKKTQDPKAIIENDEPMAIKLIIISKLMNEKKLATALHEGYEKATNGNLAPIEDRIEKLLEAHKGKININDVYEYQYIPGEGLSYLKNGKLVITIKGLDYKKAHLGIWLGEKPCDKNLKKALLTTTTKN